MASPSLFARDRSVRGDRIPLPAPAPGQRPGTRRGRARKVNTMERLTVSTRRTDDCPVVEITGELDIATAGLLDGHLHDVITSHGPTRIVLDLSGLTFCDASGLRVLVRAHHAARRCHGRLHLVCPRGLTRYLLRITRLSETIPAHRTLSDALAPAGGAGPGRPDG